MANVNKIILIGRMTRDAEVTQFNNGGAVASFTLAVNRRWKNRQTGQWEEEASFIDCKLFNRGENGRQTETFTQYVHRGHQVYIDGELRQEKWQNNDGEKRSKLVVYVDNFQFLEPRQDGGSGGSSEDQDFGGNEAPRAQPRSAPVDEPSYSGGGGTEEEIPF